MLCIVPLCHCWLKSQEERGSRAFNVAAPKKLTEARKFKPNPDLFLFEQLIVSKALMKDNDVICRVILQDHKYDLSECI